MLKPLTIPRIVNCNYATVVVLDYYAFVNRMISHKTHALVLPSGEQEGYKSARRPDNGTNPTGETE